MSRRNGKPVYECPPKYSEGEVFTNVHGLEYTIIKRLSKHETGEKCKYVCKFTLSGYVTTVPTQSINTGSVRDVYAKTYLGVACIGNVNYKEHKLAFVKWLSMIQRCYDKNQTTYLTHGAKGCTVSDEWLCFENFVKDFYLLPGNELLNTIGSKAVLDKDHVTGRLGNLIYSKDTCSLISHKDNMQIKDKRFYDRPFIQGHPGGEVWSGFPNIYGWLKYPGHKDSSIHSILNGSREKLFGSTFKRINKSLQTIEKASDVVQYRMISRGNLVE